VNTSCTVASDTRDEGGGDVNDATRDIIRALNEGRTPDLGLTPGIRRVLTYEHDRGDHAANPHPFCPVCKEAAER
jgi:hypothetical protein